MTREPTHPGAVLKEIVFPALDMPATKIAAALGITRQSLYRVMAGEQPVTPTLALKLERFLGGDAQTWLTMQAAHDLWVKARELKEELDRIQPAA